MDRKKAIWILGPAVLLIWGLIIYKVVSSLSGPSQDNVSVQAAPVAPRTVDTVHPLLLNYPDPFLRKEAPRPAPSAAPSVKAAPVKNPPQRKKEEKKEVQRARPVLRYHGRVENTASKDERHLVLVNGQSHIVTLGQEVDGVALKRVYADSVEFLWEKERIFIRK